MTSLRSRWDGGGWPVLVYRLVLLGYLFGVSSLSRDFAKIHIQVDGIPLFVGELVIAVLAIFGSWILWSGRMSLRSTFGIPGLAIFGYIVVGAAFATHGLIQGYGLAALRDFALTYYAVFYFFALLYTRVVGKADDIVRVLAAGAVAGSVVSTARFLLEPQLSWEHAAPGYQALVAWIGAVWLALTWRGSDRWVWKVLRICGIVVCLGAVYLAAYRTMVFVMVASILLLWLWHFLGRDGIRRVARRGALASTLLFVILGLSVLLHVAMMKPAEQPLPVNGPVSLSDGFKVLSSRWVRGFLSIGPTAVEVVEEPEAPISTPPAEGEVVGEPEAPFPTPPAERDAVTDATTGAAIEGSLSFRALVWRKAIDRIRSSPITGIGFGPPPALYPEGYCEIEYSPTSNCGNAHNTYLTLAMRMGIPVFLYFAGINAYIAFRFLRTSLRKGDQGQRTALTGFLAAAYVSFLIYASMSLFFESPYLSPLYWVLLALMHQQSTKPLLLDEAPSSSRQQPGLALRRVAEGLASRVGRLKLVSRFRDSLTNCVCHPSGVNLDEQP